MAHISYQPTGMWAYLYLTCNATSNITLGARYPGSLGSPSICQSTLGGMLTGKAER